MKEPMSNEDAFMKLMDEARADLEYDMTNLDRLSLKIPMLQEKYARHLMIYKAMLSKEETELKTMYADKFEEYMTGYPMKIDRRDFADFVWKDSEYVNKSKRVEGCKLKVEYVKGIVQSLDKASWNINNAIKMHLWKNGND